MPIHRESYPDDIDLKPGTAKADIVIFLYRNLDFAYTPTEIADELDIPVGTATTTLRRLHTSGYVGRMKDGYYHGLNDRDDLRRFPRSVAETEAMFAQHPDTPDAPEPDPGRAPDTDAFADAALETEIDDLEADEDC